MLEVDDHLQCFQYQNSERYLLLNNLSDRFCGRQFLLWVDSHRVLFSHDGGSRGTGGHSCENGRDGIYAEKVSDQAFNNQTFEKL